MNADTREFSNDPALKRDARKNKPIIMEANNMEQTQSSIMKEIREQVEHRLSLKYNWKRIPHSAIEKLQKRLGIMLFPTPRIRRYSGDQEVDLGTDETGRDVASGLKEYQKCSIAYSNCSWIQSERSWKTKKRH
jgi:hypothetical protein